MLKQLTKLEGSILGPCSAILVGVHGDEKCGVNALTELLPTLVIEKGTVYIIVGNPKALKRNVRYTDANLNRVFRDSSDLPAALKKSYEYKRSKFIKKYLDMADVLLDIHSSSIPESRVFSICEPNASSILKYLPTDLVVYGFDDIEPGGTDYYMNTTGKIGICFECGYSKDPNATTVAKEAILSFLSIRGHISGNNIPQKQKTIKMFHKHFSKTGKFVLSKSFENFEPLERGQLIGIDGYENVYAKKQCCILFAHNSCNPLDEVFLLGE